jgi:hypothetical protein
MIGVVPARNVRVEDGEAAADHLTRAPPMGVRCEDT